MLSKIKVGKESRIVLPKSFRENNNVTNEVYCVNLGKFLIITANNKINQNELAKIFYNLIEVE